MQKLCNITDRIKLGVMGKVKEIEVIDCHCGHEAPIGFAYDNGEGRWMCAKCMVEHLSHEYHRAMALKGKAAPTQH